MGMASSASQVEVYPVKLNLTGQCHDVFAVSELHSHIHTGEPL